MFRLFVDGDRWRAHLRSVAESTPGLVPVAKGNGYGIGLGRLARRATWLGADVLAVGTHADVPEVAANTVPTTPPAASTSGPPEFPGRTRPRSGRMLRSTGPFP